RLGRVRGRVDGQLHRLHCGGRTTDQLAPVRDAGIRGQARPQAVHAIEVLERLSVAAELDERVADHSEVARVVAVERVRLAAERERVAEAVAGERERAESAVGELVL